MGTLNGKTKGVLVLCFFTKCLQDGGGLADFLTRPTYVKTSTILALYKANKGPFLLVLKRMLSLEAHPCHGKENLLHRGIGNEVAAQSETLATLQFFEAAVQLIKEVKGKILRQKELEPRWMKKLWHQYLLMRRFFN